MPIETARTVVSLVARQLATGEIDERAACNHVADYGVMAAVQLEEYFETLVQHFGGRKPANANVPIPMRLPCPECGTLHIDEGEFATTKWHHTHSCQECGLTWRPAVVHTVGVRFLPGFRNADPKKPAVQP